MNQTEFAHLMKVNQATVSTWKQKGWIVIVDGAVDVEASKALLLEKRGTLGKLTARQVSQRSGWSKRPHCLTHNALENQRKWKAEQGNG